MGLNMIRCASQKARCLEILCATDVFHFVNRNPSLHGLAPTRSEGCRHCLQFCDLFGNMPLDQSLHRRQPHPRPGNRLLAPLEGKAGLP